MFEIKNKEKRKLSLSGASSEKQKESSLILRKAKFQAIFKFVLPLASKGTEGIKYNRISAFVSIPVLLIRRSREKFFKKNFRDDHFCFGFAKVKALSFLRLRGASGVQGISAPASCRKAHKRRFILNQWILRFANAQPLKMTALVLLLSLNLSTAFAADCSCSWGSADNKTLTITNCYRGILWDSSCANEKKTANNVIIGTGVTSIKDKAFIRASSLESITIPKTVTSIEDYAFAHTGLKSITIPKGVTSIGNGAFYNAKGLTNITIPNSVKSIGNKAFYNAKGLTNITIPEGVTSIGESAFEDAGLTSITIPEGVTSIGSSAFKGATGLTSITIPDSVTSIGSYAFKGATGLTNITIPEGVKSIGGSAFYGASSLESITIPDNINTEKWDASALRDLPEDTKIVCQGGLNTCYEKLAKYFTSETCPQNLKDAGKGNLCNCSTPSYSSYCISPSRISEATNSSQDSSNQDKETISGDFNPADCYNNGQVPYNNQCLDEYPFAKKRWTPAEANEWLHDGNDNFVVITFKK